MTSANQLEAQDQPAQSEWACPYCQAPFHDHRGRNAHIRAMHTGQPVPKFTEAEKRARKIAKAKAWRDEHKAEYKSRYRRARDRYYAQGLNAQGHPFKTPPGSPQRKPRSDDLLKNIRGHRQARMTPQGRANIRESQARRRAREAAERNGLRGALAQSQPTAQSSETPQDNLADSARAIITAARVLQSVSIGLKL